MRRNLELILACLMSVISIMAIGPSLTAQASTASVDSSGIRSDLGGEALTWAETQEGKPYIYGTDGPYSYDCSGLVYAAFADKGIILPRNTYGMLDSSILQYVPWGHQRRGDLAFYGDGHVEFVTDWTDQTFGAHDSGQTVGYITWGPWWHPTAFYRVV